VTTSCVRSCASRPSASPASWPSSCPTRPRHGACSPAAAHRGPPPRPHRRQWRPRPPSRPGPVPLEPGAHGRGPDHRPGLPRRDHPGPYQIQAAIAALHSVAETSADTDWGRIVALYEHLLALAPTPVAALNRAIAVGERDGPAAALAALDALAEALGGYYLLHAARGDVLHRLGRHDEAAEAFERAMALTTNAAEIELLRSRREPAGP